MLRRVGTSDQSTVAVPTAAAGVSGDHSRTLSELPTMIERVLLLYSLQLKILCDVLAVIHVSSIGRLAQAFSAPTLL